jgi:hypothetical protein
LLLFKNPKSVGRRMNADQIAGIAQHCLKHFRRVRLRGDQNPMRGFHARIPIAGCIAYGRPHGGTRSTPESTRLTIRLAGRPFRLPLRDGVHRQLAAAERDALGADRKAVAAKIPLRSFGPASGHSPPAGARMRFVS